MKQNNLYFRPIEGKLSALSPQRVINRPKFARENVVFIYFCVKSSYFASKALKLLEKSKKDSSNHIMPPQLSFHCRYCCRFAFPIYLLVHLLLSLLYSALSCDMIKLGFTRPMKKRTRKNTAPPRIALACACARSYIFTNALLLRVVLVVPFSFSQ